MVDLKVRLLEVGRIPNGSGAGAVLLTVTRAGLPLVLPDGLVAGPVASDTVGVGGKEERRKGGKG
jgi:hypothetical protein